MSQDRVKIAERIRQLLAKARGSDNEHEAALFAEKVQQLLARHGLRMDEIDVEQDQDEPVAPMKMYWKYRDPWRRYILTETARLYFCRIIYAGGEGGGSVAGLYEIKIIGRPHHTVVVREMSDYLITTTLRLAREYSKMRRIRLDFERGCGGRLGDRMANLANAQLSEEPVYLASGNPGNLPALYESEREDVERFMAALRASGSLGSKTLMHSVRQKTSAAADGRRAADRVNLSTQIGGAASALALPPPQRRIT